MAFSKVSGKSIDLSSDSLVSFASTGIDDNATSTAITISSAEDVGIGATPNNYSDYVTLTLDGTQGGSIDIEKDGTVQAELWTYRNSADVALAAAHASGSIVLMAGGFTERARVTSNGITFNGDTAAANALDDYEEGTWTPTISNGISSISYNSQTGHYTKVGNVVHADFYMRVSGSGSGGHIYIAGLPYTIKNVASIRGGGCSTYNSITGNTVQFYGNQGAAYFHTYINGSSNWITTSSISSQYIIGTFTYIAT